jgi:hypothetical protein
MASDIDATQPPEGNPTTAGVRSNFAAAKSEIEALQAFAASLSNEDYSETADTSGAFVTSQSIEAQRIGRTVTINVGPAVAPDTPSAGRLYLGIQLPVGMRPSTTVISSPRVIVNGIGASGQCTVRSDGTIELWRINNNNFVVTGDGLPETMSITYLVD